MNGEGRKPEPSPLLAARGNNMTASKTPRTARGFTLIELMIAIAILAIILGIAIPSYTQYVLKSGRAEAKGLLLNASQTLERCYTRYSAYNDDDCPLQPGDTPMSTNDKYQLAVEADAQTFTLTADPKGSQTNDTDCGGFTLDHTGRRGAKGGFDASVIDECW